ncbi:MAG: rod shape-determining protein MreC [Alistipes sp.]|nr:rod shape-determining protein MreC [Alistipes sp.]
MHRLIEFIKRIYVLVIFLLLEVGALWSYATSSSYAEAKILSRTTIVGGAISGTITDIGHFFSLPDQNRRLTARVAELNEELESMEMQLLEMGMDSTAMGIYEDGDHHFRYHPARVVSMTTNRKHNIVVLDRGTVDGIARDMGVITPDNELVGYVVSCSEHYAVVMPMLNTDFSTGGRIVDNGHVCVIRWPGETRYEVEAVELSIYSEPKRGMDVEVRSERLPVGIKVGTIQEYALNTAKSAYSAKLRIAADMATLDNVLIVENTHYGEIEELMKQVEN